MASPMASLLPWMITWASNSFTGNGLKRHLQKAIVYGAFCSDKERMGNGREIYSYAEYKEYRKMLPYLLCNTGT